jgi:hypothetical protein
VDKYLNIRTGNLIGEYGSSTMEMQGPINNPQPAYALGSDTDKSTLNRR